MSLKELKTDVDDDARLHLPGFVYDTYNTDHRLLFEVLPLSTTLPSAEPDVVGLRLGDDRYMFSDWSRHQLLSLFGTKEKWFSFVTLERQANEFNERLNGLNNWKILTAKAVDSDFPFRFVRGIVSSTYTDIPNSEIMAVLVDRMPEETMALRLHSGLTDRAFYAYAVSPTPITIPGSQFFAYPGVCVVNSDVGYTSLYVIPMLVEKRFGAPIVFQEKRVLRRIHRGKIDIGAQFAEAFEKCAGIWEDFPKQIPRLMAMQYAGIDEAVAAMRRMMLNAKAAVEFVNRCEKTLRAAAGPSINALALVEAINLTCAAQSNRDDAHTEGAVAGAVLFHLLFA